jgi:SAM-dependent methyltransferase
MPAIDYAKVAGLYDSYVQTDMDVPFFVEESKRRTSVLELMSGTGRLSIPLIEAGVPLSCLDSSPAMLAVLSEKLDTQGLRAPVHLADASDFSLEERFDLVLLPFNSFGELVSPDEQAGCFQSVKRHLTDEGSFLCTLHNPATRRSRCDGREHELGIFPLPGGRLTVSTIERYDSSTSIVAGTQTYELEQQGNTSTFSVPVRFRLHTREQFETLAGEHGFRIDALYGDYDRSDFDPETSPFMIWNLSALRE